MLINYFRILIGAMSANIHGSVLGEGIFEVRDRNIWYVDRRGVKVPLTLASSGIAQIIGILLPLRVWRGRLLIVEEPEVNLHPNLQLEVAEYLAEASRSRNIRIFLTTHSHYLLAKLSNLYAKGVIGDFKAYFIDPKEQAIRELQVDRETGSVELPESIREALDAIAGEALELSLKVLRGG